MSTVVPKSEIEEVLAADAAPIELVLEVARSGEGSSESRSVSVSWEKGELEELLRMAQSDDIVLTFDREALAQAIDGDVEAHGIREKFLVLAVAATAATGAAGAAAAEAAPYPGASAPVAQSVGPDDRAVARGGPVEAAPLAPDDRAVPRAAPAEFATPGVTPDDRAFPRVTPVDAPSGVSPDDRAVPRGGPVETPVTGISPDDRAFPRVTPVDAPSGVGVSPDDRAVPRGTPVAPPSAGTVSDGPSWSPSPAETGVLIGMLALMITGTYFVVGGRRRGWIRPA